MSNGEAVLFDTVTGILEPRRPLFLFVVSYGSKKINESLWMLNRLKNPFLQQERASSRAGSFRRPRLRSLPLTARSNRAGLISPAITNPLIYVVN